MEQYTVECRHLQLICCLNGVGRSKIPEGKPLELLDTLVHLLQLSSQNINDVCIAGSSSLHAYCHFLNGEEEEWIPKDMDVFFANLPSDIFLQRHVVSLIARASECGIEFKVVSVFDGVASEWHGVQVSPENLMTYAEDNESLVDMYPETVACDMIVDIDISHVSSKVQTLSLICNSGAANTAEIVNNFDINICSIRATVDVCGSVWSWNFCTLSSVEKDVKERRMEVIYRIMYPGDEGTSQATVNRAKKYVDRGFSVRKSFRVCKY
jgi:hypothetical protein